MKNKVVEIVVKSETSSNFHATGISEVFTDTYLVVLDVEIDKALKDAGYSRDDISKAIVMSAHYGAVKNNNDHDWVIGGSVDVSRDDVSPPVSTTALLYSKQSVDAVLGKKVRVPLEEGAVQLLNNAIADYLNGGSLIALTFTLNNGACTPTPSVADPVDFDWRAWIAIQVILRDDVDVPDPF